MNSRMWRRLWPVAVLLLGLALFFLFGLQRHLSFETLRRNHADLAAWVAGNRGIAELAFIACYAGVVAFSLPVAILMTTLSGFLFGTWLGAFLSVCGASLGSIAVFLAARTAFYDLFHAKAGAALARLEEGFRRDAFSYLLFLRLLPVFPFWLVNVVAGLTGVRLSLFVLATTIGIIPAACVYAGLGSGFGSLFDKGEMPDFSIIFQWQILGPLLGLAVLALIPALYASFRTRR
jgi:uncharacterized membrane protein YdjX (TVP38/TMEM64 family)